MQWINLQNEFLITLHGAILAVPLHLAYLLISSLTFFITVPGNAHSKTRFSFIVAMEFLYKILSPEHLSMSTLSQVLGNPESYYPFQVYSTHLQKLTNPYSPLHYFLFHTVNQNHHPSHLLILLQIPESPQKSALLYITTSL